MADQNGHRDPATPEEIWNILREVAESRKETDQVLKRLGQDTDRRMQETDLRLRKLDELFNGQWGKLMESLVEGDLLQRRSGAKLMGSGAGSSTFWPSTARRSWWWK